MAKVPTQQDLSAQLELANKLSNIIDSMAKSQERIDQSYESQIASMEKMTKIAEQLGNAEGIESFAASVKKVSDAASIVSTFDIFKKMDEDAKKTTLSTKNVSKTLFGSATAIGGLVQGFKNLVGVSASVLNFFVGAAKGLGMIGISILSIPFKIFGSIVNTAAATAGGMSELRQAIENVRKEFGALAGPGASAVIKTSLTLEGFKATGLSTWRVFGNLAQRMETVLKVATAMGPTWNIFAAEFRKSGGALLGFQKGLGLADEDMRAIASRAIVIGKPMTDVFTGMTKQSIALGKAFDIDQKLIGRDMAKALGDVKHFGQLATHEIAEASVYSRKLGIELGKITALLDQFETFEGAAENASKMSQAFGVSVDAFKLMESQNPAEQLDMLRKSFRSAGVSSENFSRQQLHLLTSTTGLDEATVKQAFSLKNEGMSLDQIKKKSEEAEKKQLTQAEAMSKLADSIERLVQSGNAMTGSFFKQFIHGISGGIQRSGDFMRTMIEIRQALRSVYMIGVQLGSVLPKIIPGLADIMGGMKEFFDPKKYTKLFSDISSAIKGFVSADAPESFGMFMEKLKTAFFGYFNSESPQGQRMLNGFKTMFKFIIRVMKDGVHWAWTTLNDFFKNPITVSQTKMRDGIIDFFKDLAKGLADGITWVAPKIAKVLWQLADLLANPKAFMDRIKAAGMSGVSTTAAIMQPIIGALQNAWTVLQPPLMKFLSELKDRLISGLISLAGAAFSASFSSWQAIAITYGPMITRALGVSLLNKTVTAVLTKALGRTLSTAGEEAIASAGPSMFSKIGTFFTTSAAGPWVAALGAFFGGFAIGKLIAEWVFNPETWKSAAEKNAKNINDNIIQTMKEGSVEQRKASLQQARDRIAALENQKLQYASSKKGSMFKGYWEDQIIVADQEIKRVQESLKFGEASLGATLDEQKANAKKREEEQEQQANLAVAPRTVAEAKKSLEDSKQLTALLKDPKFNLEGTLNELRTKLSSIDFKLFKEGSTQSADLGSLTKDTQRIADVMNAAMNTMTNADKLAVQVKSFDPAKLSTAVSAIQKMSEVANKLQDALGDGNLNKLDIKTKLQNVATSVGLGAKGQYTIKNKDVMVVVNLEVSMNVDQIEKAMIMRDKSIIRNRVNYATYYSTKADTGNLIPNSTSATYTALPTVP